MLIHQLNVGRTSYSLAESARVEHWTRNKIRNPLLTHHALVVRQAHLNLPDVVVDLREEEGVRVTDPALADNEGAWRPARTLDEAASRAAVARLVTLASQSPTWRWTYNCEDFVSQVATGEKGSTQRLVVGGLATLLGLKWAKDKKEKERRNARRRAQRRKRATTTKRQGKRKRRR